MTGETMLRADYDRVVTDALDRAPLITPIATGLTASIDDVYRVDAPALQSLAAEARRDGGGTGAGLAARILARITSGRGGEIVEIWDGGPAWLDRLLGYPAIRQIGGNAAQGSWALSTIGAPSVLALRDRSAIQLEALDDRILLGAEGGLSTVGATTPSGAPTKWPHGILEFAAGTPLDGTRLPRSTRVMLRFSHEPLETDETFLAYCRAHDVPVALLSGLATQPDFSTGDARWAVELAEALRRPGSLVHHELSEFADPANLRAAIRLLPVDSVGLSLSELQMATGGSGDPLAMAVTVAAGGDLSRVVVHADEWAFIVTREPRAADRDALILANALAGARARSGHPSDDPHVSDDAEFTDDLPATGRVHDGWHAVVVPSPHQTRPRGTVGLGDTFVAGLLLGAALDRITTPPTTREAY